MRRPEISAAHDRAAGQSHRRRAVATLPGPRNRLLPSLGNIEAPGNDTAFEIGRIENGDEREDAAGDKIVHMRLDPDRAQYRTQDAQRKHPRRNPSRAAAATRDRYTADDRRSGGGSEHVG